MAAESTTKHNKEIGLSALNGIVPANNLVDVEKEVLAPASLRRRVRDVLRAVLKQYENDGTEASGA